MSENIFSTTHRVMESIGISITAYVIFITVCSSLFGEFITEFECRVVSDFYLVLLLTAIILHIAASERFCQLIAQKNRASFGYDQWNNTICTFIIAISFLIIAFLFTINYAIFFTICCIQLAALIFLHQFEYNADSLALCSSK